MQRSALVFTVFMAIIQLSCKTTHSSTKAISVSEQSRTSINHVNEVDGLLTTITMKARGRRLCFGLPGLSIQGEYVIWGMDPALDCRQAVSENRPVYAFVGLRLLHLFQVPIDKHMTVMKIQTAKTNRYVGIALVKDYNNDDVISGSENAKLMTLCDEPLTDPCDFTFEDISSGDAVPTFTFNEAPDFGGVFFFESVTVTLAKADFNVQSSTVSIPLPAELQNAVLVEGLVSFAARDPRALSIGRTQLKIADKDIGYSNAIAMTAEDYARRYAETGVRTFKTRSDYATWLASRPVGVPGETLQIRYRSSDYEKIFGEFGTPNGEVFLTIFYRKP